MNESASGIVLKVVFMASFARTRVLFMVTAARTLSGAVVVDRSGVVGG